MKLIALWLLVGLALIAPAQAQVAKFEIVERGPAFGGASFGKVGAYERITARATLAVDPADRRNAVIADIDKAPRSAEAKVEATADVFILRPVESSRGNGAILVEVPNRGRELMLQLFTEAAAPKGPAAETAEAAGNGFLFSQGYTLVWVGWQADIPSAPGQLALRVPVLAGVTGPVRDEVVFDHLKSPATTALPWPMADAKSLKVSVRAGWDKPRQSPGDLSWRLLDDGKLEITRPAGFDAGAIYEITYTGRDPGVVGLGFAALRDVASYLRHEAGAGNPLAGQVRRSHLFGVSQSGRYVRDFLYLGFNEDASGRRVFDGMMPHVAGGRRLYGNSRFAQPGRAPRYPQDVAWSADAFPFTYAETIDPISGVQDSLLARCRATGTCPKVMQTDTEYEYWSSRASLVVTDPTGQDIVLPDDVRAYMITGTPHFSAPRAAVRKSDVCVLPVNPLHAGAPMRALLTALDGWVSDGTLPPASRTPSRTHGTLVDPAKAVPVIAGLAYTGLHVIAAKVDPSGASVGDLPRELGRYTVLVPRANPDGMAVAGIRMPAIEVPRATYTGWNPRAEGYGPGALCPLLGGVLPLAATKAQRERDGDPRLSLEERYPTPEAYAAAVRQAALWLVEERLLLAADAEAIAERAAKGQ
ncbi:MAG: alpha/beta hydrolase domain-containing protein [Reyranellaceae bacterium]